LLQLVGEYDALEGWVATGAISCAHWLAGLLDVELSTAREHVRVAAALRALPQTAAMVAAGTLSYAKAREVTRVATAATEAELLELARRETARTLGRTLANWQVRREPEGLAARQRSARSCTFHHEADGTITMHVRMTPDDAARVRAVLDREAHHHMREQMNGTDDAGGARSTLVQARADAVVTRLTTGEFAEARDAAFGAGSADENGGMVGDAPAGASRSPSPSRLVPPAPVELVLHRRVDGTEIDGVVLAPETAARLACDAKVRVMLHDPDGAPIDHGRVHRLVTPKLRRLVLERDQHCRHPGCRSTEFLEVHHVIPWEEGGPTELWNLELRCGYHHTWVHEHPSADDRREEPGAA